MCEHPCFRNFNSTIPVDVTRVKSYVNSFLDPMCVSRKPFRKDPTPTTSTGIVEVLEASD